MASSAIVVVVAVDNINVQTCFEIRSHLHRQCPTVRTRLGLSSFDMMTTLQAVKQQQPGCLTKKGYRNQGKNIRARSGSFQSLIQSCDDALRQQNNAIIIVVSKQSSS
jgi:hypothetical protein